MRQTRVFSSILVGLLLLALVSKVEVVTAGVFDWSTVAAQETIATDVSVETEASNSDGTKRKSGNGFLRALGAPFRALGRLFGGGKKNDRQARRITEKEAAKFETAKVIRIKDASVAATPQASAAPALPSSLSSSEFDAHLQKGRELLLAGDANAAIAELSSATSIHSKSAEAYNLLGIAYESKGLRARALQSFEVAVHADENNAEHLNNLGYLLYKTGNYERATKYLKRAAKLSPTDARIWNNLALAQCQRGKFDDAYESFVKAVGEFGGHLNMAAQLQARGYAKDAIKHLEKAQALRPNSVDVLTRLVGLYEMTGRPTDAENARRSLVALKTFADANK